MPFAAEAGHALGWTLAQVTDERIAQLCGTDPVNTVCALVLRVTEHDAAAQLAGTFVPPLLKSVLIVVAAYVAHRLIRRVLKRVVRSMREQGIAKLAALRQLAPLSDTAPMDLSRATMRTETIGGVLRSLTTFLIWTIAALMVLGTVGIPLGPLIAGAGIGGIALGFGAQNLVKDFLSGMFMLMEDQYGIGDIVDTGEATGIVEGISLRTTRLRDVQGTVWHVPNGEIRRVGNLSQQWARALLDIGVAYDTDIPFATDVIKAAADGLWREPEWAPLILEEPEVWGVENFTDNQITLRLVVKTVPLQQFKVNRELRARIKAAFDRHGIEIPFPQRTVWVRQPDGADNGHGARRSGLGTVGRDER